MSFMQAEQQYSSWIKDLVHKLKWTYGALWTPNTTDVSRPLIGFDAFHRVAEWKDGWYNLDLNRSARALPGNDHVVRDESRNEALFYSTYKSCSFQQGFGYVGLVLLNRQSTWLTGSQEVLERAVHTQALFLKTARIQTVMCMPWNNHVLELGKFEQESRNENVLHQIQIWLSSVTTPQLSTLPSPGLAAVSEDDSGRSSEAMQMSPSIASSIFQDGTNVHFGPSSDVLIKRNNNPGGTSFSISGHETSSTGSPSSRVQVRKKNNSFVRYPPQGHDAISQSLLNRHNQDVLLHRGPGSMTGHEKPLEMGTSFAEDWGAAAAGATTIFQQVVAHDSDPIISCSGMAMPGISSLLPPGTFSQQRAYPRGGNISLDHVLLTSLPTTMPLDIAASLPLPMDMLQDSSANLYGLPGSKNVNVNPRDWPSLEPSKEQSLVQLLEEFTDDEDLQRLQSPDHALIQSVVASSSESMADWVNVGSSIVTPPTSHQQQHHHHYDHHSQQRLQQQQQQQHRAMQRQFEFPQNPIVNNLQHMTTTRPAIADLTSHQNHHPQHLQQQQQQQPQQQHQPPQSVPHGGEQPQLVIAPHGQQQQQQQPGPSPRWQQNISFTTPTAWERWVARKQAAVSRYKARDPNGVSPAVLRVNQMVLKKLLIEMVPKIANEQKAREQEAAQPVETDTSSDRVRMISYLTTTATRPTDSTSIQDPQARTHMMAERRRREREKEHYEALRKLIPPTSRMDKATVLAETIQLVKRLRRRVRQLEKVNPDNSGTPNLSLVTSQSTTSQSSRGDPGSPTPANAGAWSSEPEEGKTPGARFIEASHPDFPVPATAPSLSQEENKEIIEVTTRECFPNEIRAKIRTSQWPDISLTVIHIVACLRDLGLQVLSTNISIENGWVHGDFQLKMNDVQSSRVSQFREELQEALQKAIFPADSTLEGRSLSQDS